MLSLNRSARLAIEASGALIVALLLAAPAAAVPIVIDALDSGWYNDNGFHGQANENYLAGLSGDEYRNFFVFDLAAAAGATIDAAELHLEVPSGVPGGGYNSPDPNETFRLYDVTTPIPTLVAGGPSSPAGQLTFADLGSGTAYGDVVVSSGDIGSVIVISLNAAALADLAIAPGTIAIGGAVTTLGGASFESVFGLSNASSLRQLVINPEPIPEPTTAALLALGVAALASRRRA